MLLELVAFVGLIVAVLVFFAEAGKHAPLGLVGGTILLILGLWVLVDGMQYQTGLASNLTMTSNISGNVTITLTNETITPTYASIPELPYLDIGTSTFIGLALVLLSLYGLFHYAFEVKGG